MLFFTYCSYLSKFPQLPIVMAVVGFFWHQILINVPVWRSQKYSELLQKFLILKISSTQGLSIIKKSSAVHVLRRH